MCLSCHHILTEIFHISHRILGYCHGDPGLPYRLQLLMRRRIDRLAQEKGPVNTKVRKSKRAQARKLWFGVRSPLSQRKVLFGRCTYRQRADTSVVKNGQCNIMATKLRSGKI